MYKFKSELTRIALQGRTKVYIARLVGLTKAHITNIFNGRCATRKLTALCITKSLNNDAELEDYFVRIEE